MVSKMLATEASTTKTLGKIDSNRCLDLKLVVGDNGVVMRVSIVYYVFSIIVAS